MVEDYWRALTRDIPFSLYGNEPLTATAINDLRRFSGYENVNAQNLFRAGSPALKLVLISRNSCFSPISSARPLFNSVTARRPGH